MEVGISSCRAPLLLTGGGNNAILVKAKGIINGVDPRPMRHPHHIDIKVRLLFVVVVPPVCMYLAVVIVIALFCQARSHPSLSLSRIPPPRIARNCSSLQIEIMREWPCRMSEYAEVLHSTSEESLSRQDSIAIRF